MRTAPTAREERQPVATTDESGRFRLEGVGPERVVFLTAESPEIVSTSLCVVTRRIDPIFTPHGPIFGTEFSATALRAQPVEGVVRDAQSGQPLSGVEVRTHAWGRFSPLIRQPDEGLRTTTDVEGRFRMVGWGRNEDALLIVPNEDQAYFAQRIEVADTASCDFA